VITDYFLWSVFARNYEKRASTLEIGCMWIASRDQIAPRTFAITKASPNWPPPLALEKCVSLFVSPKFAFDLVCLAISFSFWVYSGK
jgi:hypothetical protein